MVKESPSVGSMAIKFFRKITRNAATGVESNRNNLLRGITAGGKNLEVDQGSEVVESNIADLRGVCDHFRSNGNLRRDHRHG